MTHNLLRTFHLIGLALFVGSIFGHIAAGISGGNDPLTAAYAFARQQIALATQWVTLPGLALLGITGLMMFYRRRQTLLRSRWFILHAGLGVTIAVIAIVVVVPQSGIIMTALANAPGDPNAYAVAKSAKLLEDTFGAVNLSLAFAAIMVAVFKQFRR